MEYPKLYLKKFLVTLLAEESNLYCHQDYILQATSSLPLQGITSEEMKVYNALIL
jgi:hypothetical protein